MSLTNEYLTPTEVSRLLNISRVYVCRACQRGDLPNIRLGKHYGITRTDALTWDAQREKHPKARTRDYREIKPSPE